MGISKFICNRSLQTLQEPPPHPMVVLPALGGWWVDPWPRELSRTTSAPSGYKELSRARSRRLELTCDLESSFEAEQTARSYRTHFLGYEHYNFCAVDENLGPVVLSLKTYSEAEKDAEEGEATPLNHTRVIVRFSPCFTERVPRWNLCPSLRTV